MKMTKLCFLAAFSMGIATFSSAGLFDWQLVGRGGPVVSGQRLTLWNVTDKENLKYGERTWGINLVWDKTPNLHNVQVFNQGAAGSPIKYTENVAIYIKGGGYLRYEKRSFGINLGWSSKPVYEWQIGGNGGDPGQPINQSALLGLYNTRAKDFVIYDNRKVGINLVWAKDKGTRGWSSLLEDLGRLAAKPSTAMSNWISGLGK